MFLSACSKENSDVSTTDTEPFGADTIVYDASNQFFFSLSKSYAGQLNVIGGSSGFGTNLSHEVVGSQTKWTLYAFIEDGISITQTVVFYTENEDPGSYPVAEYHLDHSEEDNVDWISPDMTGDITVTSLSDSIVSGTISLERIEVDTTYILSGTLTEVINL